MISNIEYMWKYIPDSNQPNYKQTLKNSHFKVVTVVARNTNFLKYDLRGYLWLWSEYLPFALIWSLGIGKYHLEADLHCRIENKLFY